MSSVLALAAVSFGEKLADSKAFLALFKEGMALVEEVAGYLDGQGREDVQNLPRVNAISYASESMRLTTRLMQLASWLLLQRALNEGEMSEKQATLEKGKVRLETLGVKTPEHILAELPQSLQDFVLKAQRLQERVLHLETLLSDKDFKVQENSPLNAQFMQLQNAFGR